MTILLRRRHHDDGPENLRQHIEGISILAIGGSAAAAALAQELPPCRDPWLPLERRIEDLLARSANG